MAYLQKNPLDQRDRSWDKIIQDGSHMSCSLMTTGDFVMSACVP